jgi:hypothetical protein
MSIKSTPQMHKWLYGKFYRELYKKATDNSFLTSNFYIGENRMRMTFRKFRTEIDNSTKKVQRLGELFHSEA